MSENANVPETPESRTEGYLNEILEPGAGTAPEFPQSRSETFLAKMAGQDVELPTPQSRVELYFKAIIDGGGGGGDVTVESLSANENKVYTAPEGKAYSPVTVNVPNSYGAADEGKVVSNGALVAQTSDTATQNGTVDTTLINSLLVNVSGGGGGASNVVTGTFEGTSEQAGTAVDIELPYEGNGYPIACIIYPNEGPWNPSGELYNLVQRYVVFEFCTVRATIDSTELGGSALCQYKDSSTSPKTVQRGGGNSNSSFSDIAAVASSSNCARVRSATKLSVFIASSSYGFAANIEYKYWIIYSS